MSSLLAVRKNDLRTVFAPLQRVDVKDPSATGDGSWTISGYAAVFDQETTLFDAYGVRVKERIARGAFGSVLERLSSGDGLVHLNHGHDMKSAIASSSVTANADGVLPIGGLELSQDDYGLRYFARVDQADPDAIRVAAKMKRGVVNQASFAFTIDEERELEERDDGDVLELRFEIQRVRDLFDVCVCAQGAYPTTESHLRTITAASLRIPDLELRVDAEDLGILGQMLELGSCYIAEQDEPDEADNVAKMETVLATVTELAAYEVGEVEPLEDEAEPMDLGYSRARDRATTSRVVLVADSGPGGSSVAPSPEGRTASTERTRLELKARATSVLTS